MTIPNINPLVLSDNTSIFLEFYLIFIVACSNVALIPTILFAWGIRLPL